MRMLKIQNPGCFEFLPRRTEGCVAVGLSSEHREMLIEVSESEFRALPEGAYTSHDGGEIHLSPREIGGIRILQGGEAAEWERIAGQVFSMEIDWEF